MCYARRGLHRHFFNDHSDNLILKVLICLFRSWSLHPHLLIIGDPPLLLEHDGNALGQTLLMPAASWMIELSHIHWSRHLLYRWGIQRHQMLPFIVLGEKLLHIGHLLSVAEKLAKDQLVLALVLDYVLPGEPLMSLLHHAGILHRIRHGARE